MLRLIGYWVVDYSDAAHIAPQELVAPYEDSVRKRLVGHLRGGHLLDTYFGHSWCRFPKCPCFGRGTPLMGACEFTDGTWAWPEGLAHYVQDHDVHLPEEFVRHVLSRTVVQRLFSHGTKGHRRRRAAPQEVDSAYWREWCRTHGTGHVRRRFKELAESVPLSLALAQAQAQARFEAACQATELSVGLSSQRCMWMGCPHQALADKSLCARHLSEDNRETSLHLARADVLREAMVRCLEETPATA